MASVVDYLRQQRVERDKDIENLVRNTGSYSTNRSILEALGQGTPEEQDAGFADKAKGLLTGTLNTLGIPGRFVQAGLLKLAGAETPEMRRLPWQKEIAGLISGDISTSASNFSMLKTKPGDNLAERLGKMAGAFALDVATDPTSYIGAPASISRKAASVGLFRAANSAEFLDNVLAKSVKGEGLIADLIKDAPVSQFAKVQEGLNLAADVNTPAEVLTRLGERTVASQQLANRLGQALMTRGRTGLIKELENLTGSRVSALSIFKSLPDEVRGGIVATNILGKPLKGADGKYVRLTSGALVPELGKAAELVNAGRLQASIFPGNVATRMFSGQAGPILADMKKAAAGLKTDGPSRLIDYVTVKDELAARRVNIDTITGKAHNLIVQTIHARNAFNPEDKDLWEAAFKENFFSPGLDFDTSVATVSQTAGREAAVTLRNGITELRGEASRLGLDINILGDPEKWSPLILTDEAFESFKRTGKLPDGIKQYNPDKGRDSFIVSEENPDLAEQIGFSDPNNPGVVYLHAKEANNRLEQQALKNGATEEAAKKARVFIEDPVQIFEKYSGWVAGAAANKRFSDALIATGTLMKDVPDLRRLLNEWESATFITGLSNVSDAVRKAAEKRKETARQGIVDKADAKLLETKSLIATKRQDLIDAVGVKELEVDRLTRELVDAEEVVADAAPSIRQLQAQLKGYNDTMMGTAKELATRQKAVKNAKERLSTATANEAEKRNAEQILSDLYAEQGSGAEQAYYGELVSQAGEQTDAAAAKVRSEQQIIQDNAAELARVKEARKIAREKGASAIEKQMDDYATAVTNRNDLRRRLTQARRDRAAAIKAASNVENTIGLEQITAVDTLIQNVADARTNLGVFTAQNKIGKDAAPELIAQRDALKAAVKSAEDAVTAVLNAIDTPFAAVAKEYKKILLNASKELSSVQFQNLMILSNELKIQQYIDIVKNGARDDEAVMKAMGDLAASWETIRKLLPRKTFEDLNKIQSAMMLSSNAAKLKGRLIREGTEPSALVSAFDEAGYSVLGKSIGKQKLYASSGVNSVMEAVFRTKENPTGWKKFLTEYLDPALLAWKTGITIGRGPGYLVNNLVGGLWMNYIGNVDVKWFKMAHDAVESTKAATKRIAAMNPQMSSAEVGALAHAEVIKELNKRVINGVGMGDLFDYFTKRGGFDSTELKATANQISAQGINADVNQRGVIIGTTWDRPPVNAAEAAYRKTLEFMFANKLQTMGNNLAQGSEIRLRFSAFMDGFNKYKDLGAAMDQVHLLHFDYADLSDAEQWVRRLVPFYTWTRRNVPVQLRAMVLQPGKIQRALYANEEFKNAFGAEGDESWLNQVIPEYLDNQNGFVTKFKFLDNNVGAYLRLPFEDVNKLFSVKGVPRAKEFVNMLGPYTIPLELATGRDLATGRELDVLGKGRVETLGNIIPQLGTGQRIIGAAAGTAKQFGVDLPNILFTQQQEDKGVATALQLIGVTGLVGLVPVSKRGTNAELSKRVKEQGAKINEIAAKQGIDPQWMRDQIRAGVTPQQLATMIAGGMGKQSTQTEYSKLKPGQRQTALDILRGL